MGNKSSSIQPAGPPPLLTAAVTGDLAKFQEAWTNEEKPLLIQDRQQNNVLHALFSCRGRPNAQCQEILDRIHSTSSPEQILEAYRVKNNLGCLPIWILVAYGNVELLKDVQSKFQDQKEVLSEMLQVPNHQGDSPFLATCSQGNTDMVRYLKEEILTPEQFTNILASANQKGTTPLQIIIANNHTELLQFLMQSSDSSTLQDQFLVKNAAGLSLFHVCAERNNDELMKTLLNYMKEASTDEKEAMEKIVSLKDKNHANPLHVAAFCGNADTVTVLIEAIQKAYGDKAVDVLDQMDSQARTAYWLAMVQGKDAVGKLLADTGVDTKHPNMVKEIEEAKKEREERAASRVQMITNR